MRSEGFRTLLGISALAIALSVAYHYVIYIPQKEQRQVDLQRQELLDNEAKEEKAKKDAELALDVCLAQADISYSDNWYGECKSQGLLTNRCISLHDMTFDEYAKQNNVPSYDEDSEKRLAAVTAYYKELDDCSCRLSFENSDRIDASRKEKKDLCYKRYGN